MIIKVQISEFSSNGKSMMLIYNKDRSIRYEEKATKDILTIMQNEQKRFFYAKIITKKIPISRTIQILGIAPWQEW